MKVLAIIPARGGSRGVPGKNIRPLLGRPLVAYTIDAALSSTSLGRVIVSTDDDKIAGICRALGSEVLLRPKNLAQDGTPTLDVLQHVVAELAEREAYAPDAVMTLQPTSPLRTARHIDEATALFASDPKAESLVSCVPVPHIFHPLSVMKKTREGYLAPYIDSVMPTRRQDKEYVFARNGAAIYITRTKCLDHFIFGGTLMAYMMDEAASVDIDTMDDFAAAERILREREKS